MLRPSALLFLVGLMVGAALMAGTAQAEPETLSWKTNLERGRRAAQETGKPILIYVHDSV